MMIREPFSFQLIIIFLIWTGYAVPQNSTTISGTIKDSETGESLPFSTVFLKKGLTGTSSNGIGAFSLIITNPVENDTLVISHLGYLNYSIAIQSIFAPLEIKLKSKSIQLNELIISPNLPTYYIQMAMKKIGDNYPVLPFATTAYYKEQIIENGNKENYTEAIFKSYYPGYVDTSKNQHQVLLYRRGKNPSEIQFMKQQSEKIKVKQKKKDERKGKADTGTEVNLTNGLLGGPEIVLMMDFIKTGEPFLDSNQFKKFKYSFGTPLTFQNKNLIAINFESSRKVDDMKFKGEIYIDPESYAIASIEYEGELIIPLLVEPMLFIIGIKIDKPIFEKKINYYYLDGKWYPNDFRWNLNVELTKRYLFKTNEHSNLGIFQYFKINKIKTGSIDIIEKEKRYDPSRKLDEQIFNDEGIDWVEMNNTSD